MIAAREYRSELAVQDARPWLRWPFFGALPSAATPSGQMAVGLPV
jgi:hypothetical protein